MSTYPPDGFQFFGVGGTAVWGTDADVSTVKANKIGDSVVEYYPTTPTGDPQYNSKPLTPTEEGEPIRVSSIVEANRANAGDTLVIGMQWYDKTKTWISNGTVFSGVVPIINQWLNIDGIVQAPANTRYSRVRIKKSNTNFTAYHDLIGFKRMSKAFHVYRSGAFSVPGSAWTKIPFNAQTYQYGSMYNGATTQFEVPQDGIYSLTSRIAMLLMGQGKGCGIRFYKNGSPWLSGNSLTCASPGSTLGMIVTAPDALLNRGEYIDVRVWHNNVTRNIDVVAFANYFMVTHIGG